MWVLTLPLNRVRTPSHAIHLCLPRRRVGRLHHARWRSPPKDQLWVLLQVPDLGGARCELRLRALCGL